MFECPSCSGRGCEQCDQTGKFELTACPLKMITPDIWETIEYAELYEKGLPPVMGGALDQCHAFTQACRLIWREQGHYKAKMERF